ncbi:MAG TPA: hypothetical protein VGA85_00810 [Dehalococcoidales bacterium]
MTENAENKFSNLTRLIIGVLVFGSIWGCLEATLGGLLNLIIFPNKGAIMSGIGMAIMGVALAVYRKPAILPGIGIVAASFKWLNAWLLFVPASSVQIINPAMSIALEALAFTLVVAFMMDRVEKNIYVGVWVAVLASFISAIGYVYFAVYVTHSPIFARLGIESIGEFITGNGVVQAVFSGVLAPLGYLAGKKMVDTQPRILTRQPIYYFVSASTVLLCLGFSALAVIAGL